MPIKTPLLVQNGSCERTISLDSTITSPSTSEVMLLNHDYADPADPVLRSGIKFEMENIDRQKRQNLIYEPMTTTKTKQKDFNTDNEKTCKCSIHNWCLLFVFLVSSCSLALSLLIIFGVVETRGLDIQEDLLKVQTAKLRSYDDNAKLLEDNKKRRIVEGLKKNISKLNNQIPSFVRQLTALQSQLKELSGTESPQLSSTPQVERSGRLSKCRYKTEVLNVPFHADEPYTKTSGTTTWVKSREGFELVGASCSTLGGAQYGLYQKKLYGDMYFRCKCAGRSKMDAFEAAELECRMHYWECPINTAA